jgi:hypothetical protein
MAGRAKPDITDRDMTGWKYFELSAIAVEKRICRRGLTQRREDAKHGYFEDSSTL